MNSGSQSKALYENLDTTFVNLWSLLRNLSERKFIGRVHVDLEDYSADIFLNGSSTPLVHEVDHAAGTESLEEAALHRLVLRARETPGTINVFEGEAEAASAKSFEYVTAPTEAPTPAAMDAPVTPAATRTQTNDYARRQEPEAAISYASPSSNQPEDLDEAVYRSGSYNDWPAILAATGELVGAIERGINASGENFDSLFRAARLELADDYSFLDPMTRTFAYSGGIASLNAEIPVSDYVSGLSAALRRAINMIAVGERERRVRERVALEMLPVARRRRDVLERSGFQSQLDRIAGTRVM